MERAVTAVYDANILYPAPLRDLFIRVAQAGLVRARWTDALHAVKGQRESLRNPPKTAQELLATLEGHGLTQAVARLCQFIDLL